MAKGDWYIKFEIHAWLNDPNRRRMERENSDSWLTAFLLMELAGTYFLEGTPKELANALHLTPAEFKRFISDLKKTKTADVQLCPGNVRLISRRLKKAWDAREYARLAKKKQRVQEMSSDCQTTIVTSNKKEDKEEERERGETPSLAPPPPPADLTFEDSAFEHPAVVVYQERFQVKVRTNFAKAVVDRVKDLGTWNALISDKIAWADEPLDKRQNIAKWILKAYDERVEEKRQGGLNGGMRGKVQQNGVLQSQPYNEIEFQKRLGQQEPK